MYKLRQFRCLGCNKDVCERRPKSSTKYCSLECYRLSNRPQRKTGKLIFCFWCNLEFYKPLSQIREIKNFCSTICREAYQAKDKLIFHCKMCSSEFKWSKSRIGQTNPTYCTKECRLLDKERLSEIGIQANILQQNKKGLNRLEIKGKEVLLDIGLNFKEQVLMFNKFLVDVLIEDKKLIIQWDGEYWHQKPKRKKLDESQDAYMKKCGYQVLRITDRQVKENVEQVYADIKRAVQ